jgi:hypothetical protein
LTSTRRAPAAGVDDQDFGIAFFDDEVLDARRLGCSPACHANIGGVRADDCNGSPELRFAALKFMAPELYLARGVQDDVPAFRQGIGSWDIQHRVFSRELRNPTVGLST